MGARSHLVIGSGLRQQLVLHFIGSRPKFALADFTLNELNLGQGLAIVIRGILQSNDLTGSGVCIPLDRLT